MSTDPEDTSALGYGDRHEPDADETSDPDAGPASTPDEVADKDQAEG